MAVVGSTTLLEVGNKRVRGRLYPWGVVESKLFIIIILAVEVKGMFFAHFVGELEH